MPKNPLYTDDVLDNRPNAFYQPHGDVTEVYNTVYPVNYRAAYSAYIGNQDDIGQHMFSTDDLAYMARQYERDKKNYYGGFAPQTQRFEPSYLQPPANRFVPYNEYTQYRHVPVMQSLPGLTNVLQSYADQEYRLSPFTQGAYYSQSPEGTYLRNMYNVEGEQRDVQILLPELEPKR